MTLSISLPTEMVTALQKLSRDTDISISRLVKNMLLKAMPGATVTVAPPVIPSNPMPKPEPEPGLEHDRRSCDDHN